MNAGGFAAEVERPGFLTCFCARKRLSEGSLNHALLARESKQRGSANAAASISAPVDDVRAVDELKSLASSSKTRQLPCAP